ncbi:MAG: hypothetical protein PVG84_14090, partial [Desulfobacterales bacterium]
MTQSKNKGEKNREAEIEAASNQAPKQPETSNGRVVGVDIGTSKIVFSEKKNGSIEFDSQR